MRFVKRLNKHNNCFKYIHTFIVVLNKEKIKATNFVIEFQLIGDFSYRECRSYTIMSCCSKLNKHEEIMQKNARKLEKFDC